MPSMPPSSAPTRGSDRKAKRSASSREPRREERSWSYATASTRPKNCAARPYPRPDLGNTQDVALRAWLKDQGLDTDLEGGGDVSIIPQENAQILETFRSGEIDGAWVPEPWVT